MKKSDIVDIDTANNYYSKCRKVKFTGDDPEDMEQLCHRLFLKKEATTYMRGGHHCNVGRARSVDDFLNLSKSYFPDITSREALTFFNKWGKENRLNTGYCGNIRKTNSWGRAYWNNPKKITLASGVVIDNVDDEVR